MKSIENLICKAFCISKNSLTETYNNHLHCDCNLPGKVVSRFIQKITSTARDFNFKYVLKVIPIY